MKRFITICFVFILILASSANVFAKANFKNTEAMHSKYNAEWWYFNFNTDGYSGYVAILKGKFEGRTKEDYIAFVQLANKNKIVLKTSLLGKNCTAVTNKLDVKFIGFNEKNEEYTITMKSNHTDTTKAKYNVMVKKGKNNVMQLSMEQNNIETTGLRLGNDGKIEIFPGVKDSYYYTLTNLSTTMKYYVKGNAITKKGIAWFDHQYFKVNDLKEAMNNIRYNWFSMQIDNGTKKKTDDYQIIVMDSTAYSKNVKYIATIDNNGNKKEANDVKISKVGNSLYKSKNTNKNYATKWKITSKKLGIDIIVTSKLDNPVSYIRIPERYYKVTRAKGLEFYESNTSVTKSNKEIGVGFVESTISY